MACVDFCAYDPFSNGIGNLGIHAVKIRQHQGVKEVGVWADRQVGVSDQTGVGAHEQIRPDASAAQAQVGTGLIFQKCPAQFGFEIVFGAITAHRLGHGFNLVMQAVIGLNAQHRIHLARPFVRYAGGLAQVARKLGVRVGRARKTQSAKCAQAQAGRPIINRLGPGRGGQRQCSRQQCCKPCVAIQGG